MLNSKIYLKSKHRLGRSPRVKMEDENLKIAGVLELADKQASDTCVFNMRVQIPSPAPCEGTTTSCRGVFYIVKTKGFEVGAVVNDSLNGCQSRE